MAAELAAMWWALVLLGVAAGIVSGALGVGSGIVMIPALVFFFAVPQKSAQGMALAVMVPMALLGAYRYWRHPEIELPLGAAAVLAVGALGGALVGTEIAGRLPAPVLRRIFAVFVLVAGLRLLLVPGDSRRNEPAPTPAATAPETPDGGEGGNQ